MNRRLESLRHIKSFQVTGIGLNPTLPKVGAGHDAPTPAN